MGLVYSGCAHFALESGGASVVREFGEEAVDRSAAIDGLDAGNP
jgi:hypothetical protein